jgi:uncharacterized repeat protein (TIGR02543 family)
VRSGYIFRDWFKTASANNAAFNFSGEAVTGPLVLYAGWTEILTVTMNKDGGLWEGNAGQDTYTVPPGSVFTPTTGIVREGYTFAGWCTDAAKTDTVTSVTVNANTTLYAKWTRIVWTITMNRNGGYWEGAPDTYLAKNNGPLPAVIGQDTYTVPDKTVFTITTAPIIREGYSFQGWYTDSGLTTKSVIPTFTITGDMAFYAKWNEEPNITVTVKSGVMRWADAGVQIIYYYTVPYGGRLTSYPLSDRGARYYNGTVFDTGNDYSMDYVQATNGNKVAVRFPNVYQNRLKYYQYGKSGDTRFYWGDRFYSNTLLWGVYHWQAGDHRKNPMPGWDQDWP